MDASLKLALDDLISAITDLNENTITPEELEDTYTTTVMIQDDYENLDERVREIIEDLDIKAAELSKKDIAQLQAELKDLTNTSK